MSENKIEMKKLLDMATKVAVLAKEKRVQPTQLSNLLSVLEAERGEDAVYLLLAHITRQSQRVWRDNGAVATPLLKDIQLILETYKTDSRRLVDTIRKYLGLIKWINDAAKPLKFEDLKQIKSFEDFLDKFTKVG